MAVAMMSAMVIIAAISALAPPPAVSMRALTRAPTSSIASYLIKPQSLPISALVSWQTVALEFTTTDVDGWLLETSVCSEAAAAECSDWEAVATLQADETSHVVNLEPGLGYRFRVAGLSNEEGQLPFGEPTPVISSLGDPNGIDEAKASSMTASFGATLPLWPGDPPPPPSPPAPAIEEAMPWDTPGQAAAPPPAAPAASESLRAVAWGAGEQPLLSIVPTCAELALHQAQASLVAAVCAGETRLRVDMLPPGLNPALEGSHSLSEPLLGFSALALADALKGLKVQAVFASAGTAAAANKYYERFAGRLASCELGALAGAVTRDEVKAGQDFTPSVDADAPCDVYVFVAPRNARGDAVALAVEAAVERVPSACFVLLNPDLEDTVLGSTFGIGLSQQVRQMMKAFRTCYHYKGAFQIVRPANRPLERGCILRHYGGPYVAHALRAEAAGGGFERLEAFEELPSREQMGALRW